MGLVFGSSPAKLQITGFFFLDALYQGRNLVSCLDQLGIFLMVFEEEQRLVLPG